MITITTLEGTLLVLAIAFLAFWTLKQVIAVCELIYVAVKISKVFQQATKDMDEATRKNMARQLLKEFSDELKK